MAALVLFDGVCNFCNGSVNFIIARDPNGYFKFAPLQSEIGRDQICRLGINVSDIDSIILIDDGRPYYHSTAALKIAGQLSGLWPLLRVLMIVPRPLRDAFYKIIARYRYRLFGRTEACMVPTPEVRQRFIA
ncbi:MAG: DCC1-like thiol-disulfide oxidoreductase family protein [Pyrinomonadaceae bacterium]